MIDASLSDGCGGLEVSNMKFTFSKTFDQVSEELDQRQIEARYAISGKAAKLKPW